MRKDNNIVAAYKVVDTCAAEFDAQTPYYYSIQGGVNEVEPQREKKNHGFRIRTNSYWSRY